MFNTEIHDFIFFCAKNLREGMHLTVVSRKPVLTAVDKLLLFGKVNELEEQDLKFTTDDILKYFSNCGFPVVRQDAERLSQISEGWISVLYLNLKVFADSGKFADAAEIHALMGSILFDPLPRAQKELLAALCYLPEWTAGQAVYISEKPEATELLKEMASGNAFIYYNVGSGKYKLHHLLQESVKNASDDLFPRERLSIFLRRSGEWYLLENEYAYAMQFFYEARDFERLMVTIENSLGASINGEHKEQMLRWYADCPKEILDAHPVAMLVYARRLFTFNMKKECTQVFNELREKLENNSGISDTVRNSMLGEIEVNESFLLFNDIAAMSVHHRRACELLNGPTTSVSPEAAWTFGSPSVLFSYHRKVGTLSREVETMKESMPYWYRINCNQGSGAEHLMEAERFFDMGRFDDAMIAQYRGLGECTKNKRIDMEVMAAFVALRVELATGEFKNTPYVIADLRRRAAQERKYIILHTLDVCEAWLYSLVGQTKPCADWILTGNFSATRLMFPAMPVVHMVYCQTLLARKKYAELIGRENIELGIFRYFPNILCEAYFDIQLAQAYEALGKRHQAIACLENALELTMPDDVYMPFAFYCDGLKKLWPFVSNESLQEKLPKIMELSDQFRKNRIKILNDQFGDISTFGLTERELAVARLAARRMTNQEIAEAMSISENTVKSVMRIIFQKIGEIEHGRGKRKLLERFFNDLN